MTIRRTKEAELLTCPLMLNAHITAEVLGHLKNLSVDQTETFGKCITYRCTFWELLAGGNCGRCTLTTPTSSRPVFGVPDAA